MKLIKKILLGLGVLLALVLLVALFVKKDYAIERQISINKPNDEVFEYLKSLKNQQNWSTWNQVDPEMKLTFRGTDGRVGSVSAWESNMMGDGEQEVMKIIEGERIDTELRFKGMFASVSPAYLKTEVLTDSTTRVTWAMSGKMHYPMNFMQVFISMEDMIGTEYEKSLVQLKGVLEK